MYKKCFFVVLSICMVSVDAIQYCNRPECSNNRIFPQKKTSMDIVRVLSYNIRGDSAIDKQYNNAWEARKDKIGSLVQHYQPEIIGMQGVTKRCMLDLKQFFANYACIATEADEQNYDAVLFIRSDRFTVQEKQFFYLSGEKHKQHQMPLDKSHRVTVYATIFDHTTNKVCIACCTHFESKGMESRINGARMLTQELAKETIDMPLILVGDFNFFVGMPVYAEKSQKAYDLITQNLFVHDVRNLSGGGHYGPDGTWIGWPYDKYAVSLGTVGERLDGIFVRECSVIHEGVLNLKVKNGALVKPLDKEFTALLYPSDHLPIIADILVQ